MSELKTFKYKVYGYEDVYAPLVHSGTVKARDIKEAEALLKLNLRNQEHLVVS